MTVGTSVIGLLAAAAAAAGGLAAGDDAAPRPALVVDASLARDGRTLVDPRLVALDADVRLPRTAAEARINVRYFAELGRRVVVAGPVATGAAAATGVAAERTGGLSAAVRAMAR